jgi:hypothetical protein
MSWQFRDEVWSKRAVEEFHRSGYDGLSMLPGSAWWPDSLAFLLELEGLRWFNFSGRLNDDLDVFRVPSLEGLLLKTGSRRKVPKVVQSRLGRLYLADRPGLEVSERWPSLEDLRIGRWKTADLSILKGADAIKLLELEGSRRPGALDGIESCKEIESLVVTDVGMWSLEPLRGLDNLKEVRLMTRDGCRHETLDLTDITSPNLTRLWLSNANGLIGVDSLAEHSMLQDIRFLGCELSKSDLAALADLPSHVKVLTERSK